MAGHDRDASDPPPVAGSPANGLDAIYRREAPGLARYVRGRLRGAADAQDIVHDAFTRLAAARPKEALRRPEAYLQRIVRNLLVDRAKRAANRVEHLPIDHHAELAVAPDQSYAIEAEDMKRLYRDAVAALPPRTREVFLLHRVDEIGYAEIAERLNISLSTVQWHMAQAILRIGEALNR
jgi:RNA polymerase sigma factor (sigma-70 family)